MKLGMGLRKSIFVLGACVALSGFTAACGDDTDDAPVDDGGVSGSGGKGGTGGKASGGTGGKASGGTGGKATGGTGGKATGGTGGKATGGVGGSEEDAGEPDAG